jgi:isopenicillin-N N-acyltransferase like protein
MKSHMSRPAPVACLLAFAAGAAAAEPFHYPEARHGKGELKYVRGIPVLVLAGSPEEMGEQMGVLGLKPAAGAVTVFRDLLKHERLDGMVPLLRRFGDLMLGRYPEDYRREFEAMVKHSGIDRDVLVIGNSFTELRHLAGCSAMMVDKSRSSTGGPILGRNWDFPPLPGMHQYQMLVVYKPTGKQPFAVVGFPGSVAACAQATGLNAAGLAIGGNLIRESADKAPQVDWEKTPSAVVARRIVEECKTTADAEALVTKDRPAERHTLVTCDAAGGRVLEITPKTVKARHGDIGLTFATNHFLCDGLAPGDRGIFNCPRMDVFQKTKWADKVTPDDVAKAMHAVCQKDWTAHTLVFEPATMKLKVAFGDGKKSATEMPLTEVDLKALFESK